MTLHQQESSPLNQGTDTVSTVFLSLAPCEASHLGREIDLTNMSLLSLVLHSCCWRCHRSEPCHQKDMSKTYQEKLKEIYTKQRNTHTHTHPFNGPLSGTTWVSWYNRKVKPIWILLQQETVSGSGISWAIYKSAPHSRQITTPAPHHSVFYRPDALPAAQPTASKYWRQNRESYYNNSNNRTVHVISITIIVIKLTNTTKTCDNRVLMFSTITYFFISYK